ncbi:hypothetical protein TNCV_3641961 [Trichonephila clavipes]|nr:hypothetical protein TNCV_3641961 [Trichonephila clavipes]
MAHHIMKSTKERTQGAPLTSHTWFIKKFLRGLTLPKKLIRIDVQEIQIPTDCKVLEQKINRVHDVGCRQQQIPLSHDFSIKHLSYQKSKRYAASKKMFYEPTTIE